MSWTQTDLDKIENAIAKGVRKVKFKDFEAEYNSLDDMLKVRNIIREELGISATQSQRQTQYITSKGL